RTPTTLALPRNRSGRARTILSNLPEAASCWEACFGRRAQMGVRVGVSVVVCRRSASSLLRRRRDVVLRVGVGGRVVDASGRARGARVRRASAEALWRTVGRRPSRAPVRRASRGAPLVFPWGLTFVGVMKATASESTVMRRNAMRQGEEGALGSKVRRSKARWSKARWSHARRLEGVTWPSGGTGASSRHGLRWRAWRGAAWRGAAWSGAAWSGAAWSGAALLFFAVACGGDRATPARTGGTTPEASGEQGDVRAGEVRAAHEHGRVSF